MVKPYLGGLPMKTEYETWQDELAGRRAPLVPPLQLAVFIVGLAALVAFAFTHR
jgi:hypothetical protein